MECCGFRPLRLGHAGGWGQSERLILVTTQHFGVALRSTPRAYKGLSGAFDLALPYLTSRSSWTLTSPRLCPPSSSTHSGPLPAVITWTLPPVNIAWTLPSPAESLPSCRWSRLLLWADASCTKPPEARDDAPAVRGYRTTEHPPKHIGGAFEQACRGTERP